MAKKYRKAIWLQAEPDRHQVKMTFSDDLTDQREIGYILAASFFAYAAGHSLDKQEVMEMVSAHYDEFTGDDGKRLFNRLEN